MINKNQAIAQLARNHLESFAIAMNPEWKSNWHLSLLAWKLEAVQRGEIKRLMVFMPPRHGKSELCSRLFPAWFIGKNPAKQLICAAYGHKLASSFGRDVRNLMDEGRYKLIFPDVTLAEDSQAKDCFHTSQKGIYIATGVGGAQTGYGADLLLIDDPLKGRKDADSQVMRDAGWDWYTSTARTRLMPNGAIILVMTRWHKDDLAGRLLEQQQNGGDQWEVVEFPAIATRSEAERKEGEALWPEQYPVEELEKTRGSIPDREWYCLYQQVPMDPENQVFHAEFFRYYDELPAGHMNILMTVDPAFTKGEHSDFTAIMIVGQIEDKLYVLDYVNSKLNPDEMCNEVYRMYRKWQPARLGIEAVAAQRIIGYWIRDKGAQDGISITWQEIKQGRREKEEKIQGLQPYWKDGKILMKRHMTELEKQALEFPQGKRDLLDALQMALEIKNLSYTQNKTQNERYFAGLGINYQYNELGEPVL